MSNLNQPTASVGRSASRMSAARGSAGGWTIPVEDGLVGWFAPRFGRTMGTSPDIATIASQTVQADALTNATADNRPHWEESNTYTGSPAMDFDGTNDIVWGGNPIEGIAENSGDFTVVAAGVKDALAAAGTIFCFGDGVATAYCSVNIDTLGRVGFTGNDGANYGRTVPTPSADRVQANVPFVVTCELDASDWMPAAAAMGGAMTDSSVLGTGYNYGDGDTFAIGSRYVAGPASLYWDGSIAEVLVFNRLLTANERTKLERTLAYRHGVTLV